MCKTCLAATSWQPVEPAPYLSFFMRERDLLALEFDKVLQLLADCALSSAGQEACLALRPQIAEPLVREDSERTWQCFRVVEERLSLPLGAFPDIRPTFEWADHGGAALEGQKLLDILAVVTRSRLLATFFRRDAAGFDRLRGYAGRLPALPDLEAALQRCLDENGTLKDAASPTLRSLRRQVHALADDIEQRLQRTLRSSEAKDTVTDHFVTIRNNRFVIPVRPNFQTRLPGIVQDRSGSGETVFIEPLFAVELNNRLLLAQKEVAAEEHRILSWLTALVREHLDQLKQAFATLTEIDVLHAKVVFAHKYGATQPHFGSAIQLRCAKHPLLTASNKSVVPIDLILPNDKRGLIITGPNTGGKTVALKTLGLICLMAQTGFLIPTDEANELPVFRSVFADIGDAQSLEQSLSTFSAHITNVREILAALSEPALILFDEPGGGTDPAEGGALANGLLTFLKERHVALAVATHLNPVKLFTMVDGSYQIAAVAFDLDTLQPQYQLQYDVIGQSLGLPMARRLGLPEEVCRAAEATLSGEARQFSEALARLEASSATLERERTRIQAEREQLTALRMRQQQLLAEAEEKRRQVWQDEVREAKLLVRQVRAEGREVVAQLRKNLQTPRVSPGTARRDLAQFLHEQEKGIKAKEQLFQTETVSDTPPPQIGDEVEIRNGKIQGTLLTINATKARIRRGGMTFEVPTAQIAPVHGASKRKQAPSVRVAVERSASSRPEINLLGLRVREALPRLEVFLDRAILSNQPSVRIVHGMGTGALRRAIREYLSDSPYCASFDEAPRSEGGGGATVAELSS